MAKTASSSHITGIVAIIAGIIILIWPSVLNIAIALYLILIGILNLFNIEKR